MSFVELGFFSITLFGLFRGRSTPKHIVKVMNYKAYSFDFGYLFIYIYNYSKNLKYSVTNGSLSNISSKLA